MAKDIDYIITPPFRLSFPVLAEAKSNEQDPGAPPKFSCVMLFPKKFEDYPPEIVAKMGLTPEKVDLTALRKLANAALVARWPNKESRPGNLRSPLKDGDTPNGNGNIPSGHAGMICVSASTQYRPGMVDAKNLPILDIQGQMYGGCWCIAQVNAFAYQKKGNSGAGIGLMNLQKIAEGEPFSGRQKAEDVFSPLAGDAGSTTSQDDNDFLV